MPINAPQFLEADPLVLTQLLCRKEAPAVEAD
jgi:hypothetical protein